MMNASKEKLVRLGNYIERCYDTNSALKYGVEYVRGVSNTKEIQRTKANIDGRDLSKFLVVRPGGFVFNRRTTRNGERLGLGYNSSNAPLIFTEDYVSFRVKDENVLCPTFLYIFFCRNEFDRKVRYDSWGSATEFFNWEEMQEIRLPLPSIEVQRELVDTYNGLKALAEQNEAVVASLAKMCEGLVVEAGKKYPHVALGEFIEPCDERNTDEKYTLDDVRGISTEKKFIATKANMDGVSLKSYKVVHPQEFTYVADTSRRGDKIALALNNSDKAMLISSIYTTFRSKDTNKLLPEYLFLLLSRSEFDRYSRFNSWGSARETFDWDEMCRVEIPLPKIDVQRSIANLYHCMEEAKSIAATARERLKALCPALVLRGANA